MTKRLTERQREIYEFIRDKILNRGYGPTVREIGTHFEIKSPNGVMCHLRALEKKGLITRESHRSRAIQLADNPNSTNPLPLLGEVSAVTRVARSRKRQKVQLHALLGSDKQACFRAADNSFEHRQIATGDYLIIQPKPSYKDGETVLAVVDGKAAIGEIRHGSQSVRLEANSPQSDPVSCRHGEIEGRLIGIVRKY